jgi:hypothetical protein
LLVLSVVSILMAIARVYARQNAVAADRSAKAAEKSAQAAIASVEIEAARRHDEHRLRLSGRIRQA